MVSAIGLFTFFTGTVGDTFTFYLAFALDWLVAGSSVVVITTLIWPHSIENVFKERLAAIYTHLEVRCRQIAEQLRASKSPLRGTSVNVPTYLPPLRQMPSLELPRGLDPSHPFARIDLAFQAMNLHLWFFQRAIAPVISATMPAETHGQLADFFSKCTEQLHALVHSCLREKPVPPVDTDLSGNARAAYQEADFKRETWNQLPTDGVLRANLNWLIQDLEAVTTFQNALHSKLHGEPQAYLSALKPAATGTPLIDVNSLRRSTKLAVILLICFVEQHAFGFPGGIQVAFFAVFFASVPNVGRQAKTDVLGFLGVLVAWIFAFTAVLITSKLPRFPLLLSLVFLGDFLAILAFQKRPRYGIAGLQAGLALPFAFLSSTGPDWGGFTGARTRVWGIIVAGFTALVVHTYFWPVLPMQRVRALITAALRDTAVSLRQLFNDHSTWKGSPPGLRGAITGANELLDDARYLPGSDGVDPNYFDILSCLQEIDACLQYLNLVISLAKEHPLPQRFFQVIDDYAVEAGIKLQEAVQQFQQSPPLAGRFEPVRWQPDRSARWKCVFEDVVPIPDGEIDPRLLAVIARCLEQIAGAVERILNGTGPLLTYSDLMSMHDVSSNRSC